MGGSVFLGGCSHVSTQESTCREKTAPAELWQPPGGLSSIMYSWSMSSKSRSCGSHSDSVETQALAALFLVLLLQFSMSVCSNC